jgi:hypothetical protein
MSFINNLQPDKIVNVKIIKREEGSALIEINGIKTKATVDADVPDNFLAFVEPGPAEEGQKTVRLRVISPLIGTRYFTDKKENSFLEAVKSLLLENNLPESADFFESARIIYKAGLKIDKNIIKLIHMALIKYGEDYAGLISSFIKAGINIDEEFVDFFINYKNILKTFREDAGQQSDGDHVNIPAILQELFKLFFGADNPGPYNFSLGDNDNGAYQWRKEKLPDRERYYFDFSNGRTGSFIIITDCFQTSWRIEVYLDKAFLDRNREKLAGFSLKDNKKIAVSFLELKNQNLFWMKNEEASHKNGKNELFNLDISV